MHRVDVRLTDFNVEINKTVAQGNGHRQPREEPPRSASIASTNDTGDTCRGFERVVHPPPLVGGDGKTPCSVECTPGQDNHIRAPSVKHGDGNSPGEKIDTGLVVNAGLLEVLVPSATPPASRQRYCNGSVGLRRDNGNADHVAATTTTNTTTTTPAAADAEGNHCNSRRATYSDVIAHEKGRRTRIEGEGAVLATSPKRRFSTGQRRKKPAWPRVLVSMMIKRGWSGSVVSPEALNEDQVESQEKGRQGGDGVTKREEGEEKAEAETEEGAEVSQQAENAERCEETKGEAALLRNKNGVEDSDGVDCDVLMTRIIAIDSFSHRRSLEWSFRQASSPSAAVGTEIDRPTSQMGIEFRLGIVAISLPPQYQLGNLQVAALNQWKGIQAVLGELAIYSIFGDIPPPPLFTHYALEGAKCHVC